MSYTTRSTRLAKRTKRSIITTFIIIAVLMYATAFWILPAFIGGIGVIRDFFSPSSKPQQSIAENPVLPPPTLLIPFEATNNSTLNINGYATAYAKVKIYIDDDLKDTVDVKEDGSFTSSSLELQLGNNNIYGKTIDLNDKESLPSKTITLIYDNEKPDLEISEPEDNRTIKGGDEHSSPTNKKVKVSGKSDIDSQVFINGSRAILDPEGKFSTDISLNDGSNTITIKAQDLAGNVVEKERIVVYEP